jgi:DNA-directed RNA polymerase subunit RPC12/RpoP
MAKKQKVQDFTTPEREISIMDSTSVECTQCGFDQFLPVVKMRKLSGILTGEQEDTFIPIQLYNCLNCSRPLYSALPTAIQALFLKDLQESKNGKDIEDSEDSDTEG